MHISTVRLENFAGYAEVVWDGLCPGLNFLFGKNGSGKSTILQAIEYCLDYHANRRKKDLFNIMYPKGRVVLQFASPCRDLEATVEVVRQRMGKPPEIVPLRVLEVTENRQPKNRIGVGRTQILDDPNNRYANSISELQAQIRGSGDAASLAKEAFELCSRIPQAGSRQDWSRIWETLVSSGKRQGRPMSCGQYDLLAIVFDLIQFRQTIKPSDSVFIVLDNPGVFLHPACEIQILKLIEELFPKAQILVSSHSLKLLSYADPKSVFWVNREVRTGGDRAKIHCVRDIQSGSKELFFDLYGTDVSSAVLGLLLAYESPEYYRYLLDCALPPYPVMRKQPESDPQINEMRKVIGEHPITWRVLDFGAGHGDFLKALISSGDGGPGLTYAAYDREPSETLRQKLADAKAAGLLSDESILVSEWETLPYDCDVILLCNVCHEILPPELPIVLARLLINHLSTRAGNKLIIHEVETLTGGEAEFIMWHPDEFKNVLGSMGGLCVETVSQRLPNKVPLNTSIASWVTPPGKTSPVELAKVLDDGFKKLLVLKKRGYLEESRKLREQRGGVSDYQETIRQRQLASLTAQLATICGLMDTVGAAGSGPDPQP